MKRKTLFSKCLAAAVLVAMVSTSIRAQVVIDKGFFIQPAQTAAEEKFVLSLLSYELSCAYSYGHHNVVIDSARITLTYTATMDSMAICPLIYAPYGPQFNVSALKAGKYQVYAARRPLCLVEPPFCRMPEPVPQFVGMLTVGDSTGWFIEPARVEEGQAFSLKLLDHAYGSCQTNFSHTNIDVQSEGIYLSYVKTFNPGILCFVDIYPHGPAYEVKALAAGAYPVYAVDIPACAYEEPPCVLERPLPKLVDTLMVAKADPSVPLTWIDPERVDAGAEFELTLWSYGYNCNSVFSEPQAAVKGNDIYLSYEYMETEMVCPDIYVPYAAKFSVAGLKEGTYTVYLRPEENCPDPGVNCGPVVGEHPVGTITSVLQGVGIPFAAGTGIRPEISVAGRTMNVLLSGTYSGPVSLAVYSLKGSLRHKWAGSLIGSGDSFTLRVPDKLTSGIFTIRLQLHEQPAVIRRIMIP